MAQHTELPAAPVADIPLASDFGWRWTIALAVSSAGVVLLGYSIYELVRSGIGIWGVNIPYAWGFGLINYAWWVGIANGANLVAAILILRRNELRTAVNRFAEAVGLIGVICAGLYPILHLGRPWLFYWVFPYPATFEVWPQFRSSLTWDFWAISSYTVVTILLWFTGLIPDLATLRDRARNRRAKKAYGFFALGWRGSARHWLWHQSCYRLMAALILPLILVMQSTVSLEHAVMLPPGWHESSQPLYYIVSGLVQGLATVLMIAALLRRLLELERYITEQNVALLAKLLAGSALLVAYVYVMWIFLALLAEERVRRAALARMTDTYAPFFWGALALMVLTPQLLWMKRVQLNAWAIVAVALAVNVGVWLDRFSIMVAGLQHGYLPFSYDLYWPTLPEWLLLTGTMGLFWTLALLLARFLPAVALYELQHNQQRDRSV
jgi:formate-dependent nitrite reductase membrane component NrfD